MSGSRQKKQRKTGRLVDTQTFVHFLYHEIARYERYHHPFAVGILQAPGVENNADKLLGLQKVSAVARTLLRASDLLAPFEDTGVLAMLLPETSLTGACTIFERFMLDPNELGAGWTLKIAAYPDHTEVIDHLLARTEERAKAGRSKSKVIKVPASKPSSPSATPPAAGKTSRRSQIRRAFNVRA